MLRTAALVLVLLAASASAQSQPERFWLAGRYDGNRVIVYFDAVKFNKTVPPGARKITQPVAEGFFDPVELPASYIAQFQKKAGAEHFSLGDRYDLLAGEGTIVTIKLTSLVGTEGDEEVGNASYVGALATTARPVDLYLTKGYYAVRRHRLVSVPVPVPKSAAGYAHLLDQLLPFDTQTEIVELMKQRMKTIATQEEWARLQNVSPRFSVQSFYLAGGGLRYYAKLDWSSRAARNDEANDVLAAWLTPSPSLRILAVETHSSAGLIAQLPSLFNVVDLGGGSTGVIVNRVGEDDIALRLFEYRDGASLADMRLLQQIAAGE